jgi:hypothetical protein
MSNLVLLSGERAKREQADQMKVVKGLQELLAIGLIISSWNRTLFGYLEVDIKPCTDLHGWLSYS